MLKILLAEDTPDLNRALTMILTHEGYFVDSVLDGEMALDHLHGDAYDAVILDIMMPKKNGMEVLAGMRSEGNTAPVLLLTAKAEVDDRVAGLDAGADDYLTKPFAMKELRVGNITLNADRLELRGENAVRLSIKEFELLQLLMKNSGRPLDTTFLLKHIWPADEKADDGTVWLYICYLRSKLTAVAANVSLEGICCRIRRFRHDSASHVYYPCSPCS